MLLETQEKEYLDYCRYEKNLSEKTIRAYRVDLGQFDEFCRGQKIVECSELGREVIRDYVRLMHDRYKTKTIKRKIACLKSFMRYMYVEGIIDNNPFFSLKMHFREEKLLPKAVSTTSVQKILTYQYDRYFNEEMTQWKRRYLLRDILVVELLFATGVRVSELCSLTPDAVDFDNMRLRIYGKGSKERLVQIGNEQIRSLFYRYLKEFREEIKETGWIFVTKNGTRFSEQAARAMLHKYRERLGMTARVTPHMFRHAFATCLLEEDVDIRYIQKMLGHSSISTTQVYCFVASEKERQILEEKHPRNQMNFSMV